MKKHAIVAFWVLRSLQFEFQLLNNSAGVEQSAKWKLLLGSAFAFMVVAGVTVGPASAADTTQHVLNSDLKDGYRPNGDSSDTSWYREDTRVGGGVGLSTDYGNPSGPDKTAVVLTTNDHTSAKAQLYTNQVNGTLLSDINGLSYDTYQDSSELGNDGVADVAYQIQVDYNGLDTDGGFTTLTFEPYINPDIQGILPVIWQHWEATGAKWYSSRQITCGDFSVAPSRGSDTTTPNDVGTNCPSAVRRPRDKHRPNNPSYITAADNVHFATATNSYTADFGPD